MIKYRALCSAAILGLVATLFAGCGDGDNTLTKICNPSEAACSNDGNSGQVCNADGTRLVDFSCSDGEVCEDGACIGQCDPQDQRCASEAAAQVCSEDGKQWIPVPCSPGTACTGAEGCVPTEAGVQICEPADAVCGDDNTAKICDADGSAWIFITCESDEHCVSGACVFNEGSACTPRETQCVDGDSAKCNDDGDGWEITSCPATAPCLDGVCTGIACVPGSTKCSDQPIPDPFNAEPWYGYDFGAIYTCNDAGDGWTLEHCSLGEYCIYDHISNADLEGYIRQLGLWYATWPLAGASGTAFPVMDLSDSVASCSQPGCLMPHPFRPILEGTGWGNTNSSVASSFCGTPDMPSGVDTYTDVYTQCEGLPPFRNLEWVSYDCQDHETCAVDFVNDYDNAYCSSICTPGEVACADSDSLVTCLDDGTWGLPEICPTDETTGDELGYEYVCEQVSDFQGGMTAACVDPVCQYWLDQSATGVIPEGYGACTPDGQFRPCVDNLLGDAVDCEGICVEHAQLGGIGSGTNTADQDPGFCGFECVDGQQQCVHQEALGSPLYRVCVDGKWSGEVEVCADNLVCWDGGDLEHAAFVQELGQWDLQYETYYFAIGDFLTTVICGGECNPGRTVCVGEQTMTCDDDGHWQDPEDCSLGVCEDHATFVTCEAACIPGTLSCDADLDVIPGNDLPNDRSNRVYVCGNDGRWDTGTDCDDTDADFLNDCRVDNGGVVLGCVQCIGTDTNGNAEQVADSECRDANASRRQCNDLNQWGEDIACPDGELCTLGTGPTAWCALPPPPP